MNTQTLWNGKSGQLLPAYGRDYKNKKEVQAALDAGKDFILVTYQGETYINKEQIAPGSTFLVRYSKQMKVGQFKV